MPKTSATLLEMHSGMFRDSHALSPAFMHNFSNPQGRPTGTDRAAGIRSRSHTEELPLLST